MVHFKFINKLYKITKLDKYFLNIAHLNLPPYQDTHSLYKKLKKYTKTLFYHKALFYSIH